jgi:AcrR family transcriptional regulator
MTMVTKSIASRRDRKKSDVRAKIIDIAIDSFSKYGIARVTVDEIAEAADIGKGTIYNYFDTKEAVVVAFMVDLERKVQGRIPKITKSRDSLASILTEYIQFQFRLKKRYHQFVRVFLTQMFSNTEHFIPYMVEMQKVIDPPLESLFLELKRRKEIRANIDISKLIGAFKTMHVGLTCVWAVEGPPFKITEQILKFQMEVFSKGLETKRKLRDSFGQIALDSSRE